MTVTWNMIAMNGATKLKINARRGSEQIQCFAVRILMDPRYKKPTAVWTVLSCYAFFYPLSAIVSEE